MRNDGRRTRRGLAGGLIQPELLLPAQWLCNPDGLPTSEKRLIAAVVMDAVQCFKTGNRRARAEAAIWFSSKSREWPFSFENLCEALSIDADGVRAALLRGQVADPTPSEASNLSDLSAV